MANCVSKERYRHCEAWAYGNKIGCRWNKSQDDIQEKNLVGYNVQVNVKKISLTDEFIVDYEKASFGYTLNGNNIKWRKVDQISMAKKEIENNVYEEEDKDLLTILRSIYPISECLNLPEDARNRLAEYWIKCMSETNEWIKLLGASDGYRSQQQLKKAMQSQKSLAGQCGKFHRRYGELTFSKITNFKWGVEFGTKVEGGDGFIVQYDMFSVYLYIFDGKELNTFMIPQK